MGKHEAPSGRRWSERPGRKNSRQVPDPEDRSIIEPDRDAAGRLSDDEQAQRDRAHTDRDPQEDFHLASDRPQRSDAGG